LQVVILVGFLLNAAVPPLHAWLPDAYGEATFNGSVFLCAFTTKTAVYALMPRVCRPGDPRAARRGMALYGVVYAVLENDSRRLLAYHIISQVGYMVAGVGSAPSSPSTAPAPMPSRTSSTRACSSWAAARCCT
jgi:multicomponent Na+:H+ antiporter subunit D